jgi:hypothetical protein
MTMMQKAMATMRDQVFKEPQMMAQEQAREQKEEHVRSTYQNALKLLQDILLFVPAHGVFLLRALV